MREGELGAGDTIEVMTRPAHGITSRASRDAILIDEALLDGRGAPELPADLAEWLRERAA